MPLYAELARITREDGLDWSRVRTFNLDEFIGLEARRREVIGDSWKSTCSDTSTSRLEHIGFLDGLAVSVEDECERYERAIAAAGGIDIMVLGIGANGHIGFNEPCDVLPARTHRVVLEPRTRAANVLWFGGDINAVPRAALSMGMATILSAREVVLMATGEPKADAVGEMIAAESRRSCRHHFFNCTHASP